MRQACHCHRHLRDAQRGHLLDSGRPKVYPRLVRAGLGRWQCRIQTPLQAEKSVVLRHQVLQVDHREVFGESRLDAQNAQERQNRRTRRAFGGHQPLRHLRRKSCHLRPEIGCCSPSRIRIWECDLLTDWPRGEDQAPDSGMAHGRLSQTHKSQPVDDTRWLRQWANARCGLKTATARPSSTKALVVKV